MARTRKIRPGHKICQMLISGETVTVEAIELMMKSDPDLAPTLYKLSGYVNDIRTYDGGVVEMVKNGRRAVAYRLLNAFQFNPETGQKWTVEELQKRRDTCYPTDIQLAAMEEMNLLTEVSEMLASSDNEAFIIEPDFVDTTGFDVSEDVSDLMTETKPARKRSGKKKAA